MLCCFRIICPTTGDLSCCSVFILFQLLSFLIVAPVAADPIALTPENINGNYIGTHLAILNEGVLFQQLSKKWEITPDYRRKMLSGQLHSDHNISYRQEATPVGYKARLKHREPGFPIQTVSWGVYDVQKKTVAEKFISVKKRVFNLNFNPHAYWLRFQINNSGDEALELVLELDKHLYGKMDLFIIGGRTPVMKQADFTRNLDDRAYHYKHPALNLTVPSGLQTYYLRMDGYFTDVIPLRLWSKENFFRHISADLSLLGIMVGIFLFIFVYTLVLFGLVRDGRYIYLTLLTLCSLVIHLCVTGFGFQFLWPRSALWSIKGIMLFMPFYSISFILFCRSFLESSEYTPRFDKLLLTMAGLFVLLFLSVFILSTPIRYYLLLFYIFSDSCFFLPMLYPAVIAVRAGHRAGSYILAGLSLFIVSVVEGYLSSRDIIPFQWINYLHFRSLAFIIVMTWGLFDQINGLKNSLARVNVRLENAIRRGGVPLKDVDAGGLHSLIPSPSDLPELNDSRQGATGQTKRLTDDTRLKLEKVKLFLDENFTQEILREDLADSVSMSPDHLGRMFKKHTGEKINAYLARLRISAAVNKLTHTEEKIIDIAFAVGFSSLRTFNQNFRLIMGTTPSKFRKERICSID